MTAVLLVLALIVLAGGVLAFELLHIDRRAPELLDFAAWQSRLGRPPAYASMVRLFSRSDADLLRETPELFEKLKSNRRKAMRLYLADIRADFQRAFTVCRLLTPVSNDADLTSRLLKSWVQFHLLYAGLQVRGSLGYSTPLVKESKVMLEAVEGLRREAHLLLQQAPVPVASAA